MTGEQIKELIQTYIDANDWYSILKLITYQNAIQKEVIEDGGIPTYPSFFENNNRAFYFNKALELQASIKSLMSFGATAVYRLFNVSNSMLRSYGIEWEEIQEFESSRYAVDTGLSGQELFNYTYQRMADFYKITLPNSTTRS
jgi:hypothetical protein